MADRPTQEWLKPDQFAGTMAKVGNPLPLPTDDTLTQAEARAQSRGGESAGQYLGADFYTVGPLTAKNPAPHSTDLIGGRHPQQGPSKIDTEDAGGVFVVRPLPGARRQLIDPDQTKPISYGDF